MRGPGSGYGTSYGNGYGIDYGSGYGLISTGRRADRVQAF